MSERQTLYSEIKELVSNLEIGDCIVYDLPGAPNSKTRIRYVKAFRKYLCEIGDRHLKKFRTRIVGNQLFLLRVDYFEINHSINS